MKKIIEFIKSCNFKIKLAGFFVVMGVIIVEIIILKNKEPELTVVSETSLKEMLEIDELATLEYFYNSVTQVLKEDSDKVKYHVAYKGNIRYGINFEQIEIVIDETNKQINVVVPEVNLLDSNVDIESLDFIFEKDKYETETVIMEAKEMCESDLENKASQNVNLKKMAKENAVDTINALLCSWIEQVEEYEVVVK